MNDQAMVTGHGAMAAARAWTARMVAPLCDGGRGTRASFVRADFTADFTADFAVGTDTAPVRLAVSAQGLYRAFVNGHRVGHDLLTPGLTCYDDRIAYQSYDISALVQPGSNRIEIWLADGWFRSPILWGELQFGDCWGTRIAAIAEICQGDRILASTDATWRSGLLPITLAEIYDGEDFDARLETLTETHGVEELAFDHRLLVPHETAAVRELEPLEPVEVWTDDQGRQIFDFGQNLAGQVRFSVSGQAGATVRVDHAEVLGLGRAFDNRNYRSARGAAVYTLKGGGEERYQPHFTFMGYRYARVTLTGDARLGRIVSVPISSIPQAAGGITTGVAEVNRLVLNTLWSQRSNFIEIPTDCPQRDERLGWTGDAQVFAGTAAWLGDVEAFLKKFLRDVVHDQRANGAIANFSPDPTRLHQHRFRRVEAGSTGWGDAITVIPWQLYLHYGDAGVLRDCFPAMLRWLDYLWNISDGPIIRPEGGFEGRGFTFGDWLQPKGGTVKPRSTIADDCAATIYHFISTDLAARIADVLGEARDSRRLRDRADLIRAAFVREYFSASGRLAHNDQTSYALAFLHGLVPAEHVAAAKDYFRKVIENDACLIGTGFIGTPALLPALTMLGLDDLAARVFLNRESPGWLYQVDRGATTIWERWDAIAPDGKIFDPEMNSYNHYAYGAVCQWLFESVAGMAPSAEAPGFRQVIVNPVILPDLSPVSAWHDTRHGRLAARWSLNGAQVTYQIDLPSGTSGLLLHNPKHQNLRHNDVPLAIGAAGYKLGEGHHTLAFTLTT